VEVRCPCAGPSKERHMAVSGVGGSNYSQTAQQASSTLAQNMDAFLLLLTTQLKNQDPLSPQDSTQWVTQLVQFSGVEQAIHQRQALENLVNLQLAWQSTNAVGYIGKTVEASGEHVYLEKGEATIRYTLDDDAGQATVIIKDLSGKTVRELTVDRTKGTHTVTWNGKDSNGVALDDGFYSVSVKAGVVEAIENEGGQILLKVGDQKLAIGHITAVRETPPASTETN
jgi:flagellar basal-body rod modification protein FlgD